MTARALVVLGLSALAAGCVDAAVTFDDAWIRGARPGSTVAAGYCSITNRAAVAVAIVEFVGPGRVEMHETRTTNGVSRMRPVKLLTIEPGQTVTFEPGAKHLMLFDLDPDIRETTLRAVLDDGTRVPVPFAVRPWRQR